MSTHDEGDVDENAGHPIFRVLGELGPEAILRHVPIKDLVRSELVCKGWQRVVHYYLENSSDVELILFSPNQLSETTFNKHFISISKNDPNSMKIVEKLRFSIQNVTITADRFPGKLLQTIESNNFKVLRFDLSYIRYSWDSICLLSAIPTFKNITKFQIYFCPRELFNIVHLLVIGMPKLEILKLHCGGMGGYEDIQLSTEFIESVSQLSELKRLSILYNAGVDDRLLEALALGCKKLEYLDISGCRLGCIGSSRLTARGVAALWRRSPSAATTLEFTHYYRSLSWRHGNIEDYKFDNPLCEELETLCCVNLRQQHLEFQHISNGHNVLTIEGRLGCNAVYAQDPRQELKILFGGGLLTRRR